MPAVVVDGLCTRDTMIEALRGVECRVDHGVAFAQLSVDRIDVTGSAASRRATLGLGRVPQGADRSLP